MGKLLIVGTVAFDAIETPFGKTDKILGGAATYIGIAASQFDVDSAIISIVGDDLPQEYLDLLTDRGTMPAHPPSFSCTIRALPANNQFVLSAFLPNVRH